MHCLCNISGVSSGFCETFYAFLEFLCTFFRFFRKNLGSGFFIGAVVRERLTPHTQHSTTTPMPPGTPPCRRRRTKKFEAASSSSPILFFLPLLFSFFFFPGEGREGIKPERVPIIVFIGTVAISGNTASSVAITAFQPLSLFNASFASSRLATLFSTNVLLFVVLVSAGVSCQSYLAFSPKIEPAGLPLLV